MDNDRIDPNPSWEPGDIALCVRGGPITTKGIPPKEGFPKAGAFYRVREPQMFVFVGGEHFALAFHDAPMNVTDRVWKASRFIKVTPPENMSENEELDLLEITL